MANFLFSTILTTTLTPATTEVTIALGKTTFVGCTLTNNMTLNTLTATTGNVDGMVVVLQNITGSFALSIAHTTGSPTASRFRNFGLSTILSGTGYGAFMFRYFASQSAWLQI